MTPRPDAHGPEQDARRALHRQRRTVWSATSVIRGRLDVRTPRDVTRRPSATALAAAPAARADRPRAAPEASVSSSANPEPPPSAVLPSATASRWRGRPAAARSGGGARQAPARPTRVQRRAPARGGGVGTADLLKDARGRRRGSSRGTTRSSSSPSNVLLREAVRIPLRAWSGPDPGVDAVQRGRGAAQRGGTAAG